MLLVGIESAGVDEGRTIGSRHSEAVEGAAATVGVLRNEGVVDAGAGAGVDRDGWSCCLRDGSGFEPDR